MAYDPAGGGPVSNPGISYAASTGGGGGPSGPSKSGGGGGGGGATNRKNSINRRQDRKKNKTRDVGSGAALITNDKVFGLDRPYLGWNVYAFNNEAAPGDAPAYSTTSATFVPLAVCANEPQHPRLRVRVRAVTGAATTGEFRLIDRATGTVLAGPVAVGAASAVEQNLDGVLVGPVLSGAGAPMKVDVEARVTAGAASIGVLVVYALGIGSA